MIRVLDDKTINKIAAGEVVERPAAALKELVENSIDAGADEIRVELQDGGKRLILVRDNGKGMASKDAELCLHRHATSKIQTDADLFKVMTLGFRGEAVPSIAAVSRFELKTKTENAPVGTCIRVDGGNFIEAVDIGCPKGTQVSVRNLFYNVPPRKKFLRTNSTELSHCQEALIRQALIRHWIDFELIHNGLNSIRAPKAAGLSERAEALLGPAGKGLIEVDFTIEHIRISGLVSPVGVHRATSSNNTYLYVNGRYVKDTAIRRAIKEAYSGLIPKGRFPVVVLKLDVPPEDVDVNVHPAKTEVRFQKVKELSKGLTLHIKRALQTHGLKKLKPKTVTHHRPSALPDGIQLGLNYNTKSTNSIERFENLIAQEVNTPYGKQSDKPAVGSAHSQPKLSESYKKANAPFSSFPKPIIGIDQEGPICGDELLISVPANRSFPTGHWPEYDGSVDMELVDILPVDCFAELNVIGQLGLTYILCEGKGELVIIDQHAAHERIMLYKMASNPSMEIGDSQILLTPLTISMTPKHISAIEPHLSQLGHFGLEVEPFGENMLIVRQRPGFLEHTDLQPLLEDIADDLMDGGSGTPIQSLLEHRLATRACHNSIRAGDKLSHFQMNSLLDALDEVDFGVCAHGRPVAIIIPPSELEKRFHRS
ncbi:MAG: DNA mismatch repair endonuclease MutL [Myxococcota bacterium]